MTHGEINLAIDRQRNLVLDLDAVVGDARAVVERDVEALQSAVRERDRATVHLEHLVALAASADDVSDAA
jgi:hypothetical protein